MPLKLTFSRYVPGATMTVSPLMDASIAAWIVGKLPGTFRTLEALAGMAAVRPIARRAPPAAEIARKRFFMIGRKPREIRPERQYLKDGRVPVEPKI